MLIGLVAQVLLNIFWWSHAVLFSLTVSPGYVVRFSLLFNLRFAQTPSWCYLYICEYICSTLTGGRGQIHCDLPQSQFFICMHIFDILSVYIVLLTVHFLRICISSSKIIYTKHEKYFKGLVIIVITWCPPIGWFPRPLAQSRLWIIRPSLST